MNADASLKEIFGEKPTGEEFDSVSICIASADRIRSWSSGEVKNPETIKTFPANAQDRAQAREHQRMRALGQRVEVIGTLEGVAGLLS